jgi:hypothetical protein
LQKKTVAKKHETAIATKKQLQNTQVKNASEKNQLKKRSMP